MARGILLDLKNQYEQIFRKLPLYRGWKYRKSIHHSISINEDRNDITKHLFIN